MIVLMIAIIAVIALSGFGTAKGIKGDAQFIGDKTYEILDK